jgi:hypothetical protein
VILIKGADDRTLLVNSVEMARTCRRWFGGVQNLLGLLEPFVIECARRHGLERVHASARLAALYPRSAALAPAEYVAPAMRRPCYTDFRGKQHLVWKA